MDESNLDTFVYTDNQEIIKKWVETGHDTVLILLRCNTSITEETLDELARSGKYNTRRFVASHPNTSQETLRFLSHDVNIDVVYALVQNQNAPLDALDFIAHRTWNYAIHNRIRHHRNCSERLNLYISFVKTISLVNDIPMKLNIYLTNDVNQNLNNVLDFVKIDREMINRPFFSTPFFRRYLASLDLSDMVTIYLLMNYIRNVHMIYSVWNDVPVDYFQNYSEILQKFELFSVSNGVLHWLQNNVTAQSFLHMIAQHYSKNNLMSVCTTYRDTMEQLSSVIKRQNIEVTPPKRWRLNDLHDHSSYLYMKSTVENEVHTNEFIPFPIESDGYKIYQPKDTMELALWGKRVRNCVLSYEKKIFNRESTIVLIERDNKPTYTVELDYSALKTGSLGIKQAVGIANTSLKPEETETCIKLLNDALKVNV